MDKSAFVWLINESDVNKRIAILATKAELKRKQDKIVKLEAIDSSFFRGKTLFEDDATQNYLVF